MNENNLYLEKSTWATGAMPMGAPGKLNRLANDAGGSPGRMMLTGVSGVGLADDVCGKGPDSRNAGRICEIEQSHGQ
jgi:hypothetical protein